MSRYLYLFITAFTIFILGNLSCYSQEPHLNNKSIKEGLLELKFKDTWRYFPGDSLTWANPNFDDAQWYKIDPIGLKAYNMPDSLWQGFGWWRITFTADSEIRKKIERLYFYSWGAAEIYLDGKLVGTYGNFSKNSQSEKTYTPNYDGDRPLKINPKDTHTLAIRFSNHQAKKNHQIFRVCFGIIFC